MSKLTFHALLGSVILLLVACGDQHSSPTAPPGSAVTIAIVDGGASHAVSSPALTSSLDPAAALAVSRIPMGNPYAINESGLVVGNCGGACGTADTWREATGEFRLIQTVGSALCCTTFTGVNTVGQAIAIEASGGCFCLFVWADATSTLSSIPTPGHVRNFWPKIDDAGNVSANDDASGGRPYFIPNGGALTMLQLPAPYVSGWARDHNRDGVIVGYINKIRQQEFAARWPSYTSAPQALPSLGGDRNEAYAINAAGDIVGWGEVAPGSGVRHALLWPATGGVVDLTTWANPCSGSSAAWAINGNGVIVGQCDGRPVLWTAAQGMRVLPLPPGETQGIPSAINNAMMITGRSPTGGTTGHFWKLADQSPPVVTPTVTGTLGDNGWYTSDVSLTWHTSDPESGIASMSGCGAVTLTTDSGGITYTCTATNGVGLSSSNSVTIKRDASVPVVTPEVQGTIGSNGWYTSDVFVTWTTSDPESGITSSSSGCGAVTLTTDSGGITYTCTATNGVGLSSTQYVTIKRDASAPVVTSEVDGTLGDNGWYTSDVAVSFRLEFGPSGQASVSGCSATTLTSDGDAVAFTCSATSGAGLSASAAVSVKRDATAPTITYSPSSATYTVDQAVTVSCSASDAMSGIASSTCANASSDAYTFGLGVHALRATATDNAGNSAAASASFTVVATPESLCALVHRWVTNAGVANSLCVKLKQKSPQAFVNELHAQSGKFAPSDKAALLEAFASALSRT